MRKILFLFLFLFVNKLVAQEHAWVYFIDKPNEITYLENPITMLTQRAIDRRLKQNIAFDVNDVPVSLDYINQINLFANVEVKAKSRWLNAVHVFGVESVIRNLIDLTFVNEVEFAANALNYRPEFVNEAVNKLDELEDYNYGNSINQIEMLGVDFMHENDFTGTGLQIAVIDAGFPNVDTFDAFERMRNNNQILGGYNYVTRTANFYTGHRHGTSVLSTIAGFVDGELIGTAPNANFYLFITEDVNSETPLEESLWVEAVEKADYLGVDIVNTSLGYQAFDEAKYNHTYQEMDGNTLYISRAANIAVAKGMILVIAAGNTGNSTVFNTVSAPAIADKVLAIGAVNSNGEIVSFSSYGPSSDGDIKPNLDAKGAQTAIINEAGNVVTGNGTSYASPVMAGAIASFWQAFPNKSNVEIVKMLEESAHLYINPTNHAGYGIPNLKRAYQKEVGIFDLIIYPNPTSNNVYLRYDSEFKKGTITVFDLLGKLVMKQSLNSQLPLNIKSLSNGLYLLQIQSDDGKTKTVKLIKN